MAAAEIVKTKPTFSKGEIPMGAKLDKIRNLNAQKNTPAKESEPAEPTVAVPLKFACGCLLTPDGNANNNCPKCAAENKKQRAVKMAKKQRGPDLKQRLPDGAVFHVTYTAASTSWTGSLDIEGCPRFQSVHGGVFGLLGRLDDLYRAWCKRNEKVEEVPVP